MSLPELQAVRRKRVDMLHAENGAQGLQSRSVMESTRRTEESTTPRRTLHRGNRAILWLIAGVALVVSVKLLIDRARLPERTTERSDILFISIDTLRADHLSLYGYERSTTPGIDELASRAIVFENAYSQSPKTAISHMSMLTGLYPEAHGVRQWTAESGQRLSDDIPTLATILAQYGYQTAAQAAGGHMRRELGFDQGIEHFEKIASLRESIDRGVDVIRRMATNPQRPYFFFLHTYAVHDPYVPERKYRKMFVDPEYAGEIIGDRGELRRLAGEGWNSQHELYWARVDRESPEDRRRLVDLYDSGIRQMDDQISRFLTTLRADGVLDNAITVFVSDHGEEFLEHGGFLHETVYQELLRVPLILSFPGERGRKYSGRREHSVVRLIDLAPTLLDFIGVPIPEHIQGRSLLPILSGEGDIERMVLSSWPRGSFRSLRSGDWKLVRHGDSDELYDLESDPREEKDLATTQPSRVSELRDTMRQLVSSSRTIRNSVRWGEQIVPDEQALEELRALGYID